jgi:dimethylhistidine N-methyltransferase
MSPFARDVREGLTRHGQRTVPSMYLYDELGTALFEAITLLPEYGLTRADERLLQRHAGAILEELPGSLLVAELGSGTGRKTRWILEALARREPVRYYPIDISPMALARCRQELAGLGAVNIVGLEHSYVEGVGEAVTRRRDGQRVLLLFLGSTIGNFERPAAVAFLREIRDCLAPGDALLLGTDLVKPLEAMLAAYDDPTGVTAAFNRNLLARMNRELGADFDPRCWDHEARWNAAERRIEMHLRSRARQTVKIPGAGVSCDFAAGETIWTEACHKFDLAEVACLSEWTGFTRRAQWVDDEWPFAESLWVAP